MEIRITAVSGTRHEENTRAQLERVVRQSDLSRWTFTREVRIEEGVIPHSHPVLTLNTRHWGDDGLLLSTYLHEQLHWGAPMASERVQAAMQEFRTLYPSLPVGYPRGCRDAESNLFHLIVCPLEVASVCLVAGAAEAARVLDYWCGDHYTAIYQLVRGEGPRITAVLERHALRPEDVIA